MTNFIPIFPLGTVVYPGEKLNLHIFEPSYKQLIIECNEQSKPFGIPTVLKKEISESGTLTQITKIVEIYADGTMDISIEGLKVFRILEIVKTIPDKLFSGAIVTYPHNEEKKHTRLMKKVVDAIHELYSLLKITKDFKKEDEELTSYDVAHHAGLSLEEEYELLELMKEGQRLVYLQRHLLKTIPIIAGAESLKKKIQLNGHFKELKGFNFDL